MKEAGLENVIDEVEKHYEEVIVKTAQQLQPNCDTADAPQQVNICEEFGTNLYSVLCDMAPLQVKIPFVAYVSWNMNVMLHMFCAVY